MKILNYHLPKKLNLKHIKYLLLHKRFHDFDLDDSKMEASLEKEQPTLIPPINNVHDALLAAEDNLTYTKKTFMMESLFYFLLISLKLLYYTIYI